MYMEYIRIPSTARPPDAKAPPPATQQPLFARNQMRTKKELIDALIDHTDQSRVASEAFIEALGDILRASLVEDGEFILPGVGKFTVKQKPARDGRNPATGETIKIPARKAPAFTAAKLLRDTVDQH